MFGSYYTINHEHYAWFYSVFYVNGIKLKFLGHCQGFLPDYLPNIAKKPCWPWVFRQ